MPSTTKQATVYHTYTTIPSHQKIRFALVGCGRIAQQHFAAIKQHSRRCELVDVCDTDPTALAAAALKTNVTGHADLLTMLKATTADCIILATPSRRQACHHRKANGHTLD